MQKAPGAFVATWCFQKRGQTRPSGDLNDCSRALELCELCRAKVRFQVYIHNAAGGGFQLACDQVHGHYRLRLIIEKDAKFAGVLEERTAPKVILGKYMTHCLQIYTRYTAHHHPFNPLNHYLIWRSRNLLSGCQRRAGFASTSEPFLARTTSPSRPAIDT